MKDLGNEVNHVEVKGDYVWVGCENSDGDYCVTKLDLDGNVQWEYTDDDLDEMVKDIAIDDIGNAYIASQNGTSVVQKISSSGKRQWSFDPNNLDPYDLDIDSSGNTYVALDDRVQKITPDGDPDWFLEVYDNNVINSIEVNNGYIYTGGVAGKDFNGEEDSIRKINIENQQEEWAFTLDEGTYDMHVVNSDVYIGIDRLTSNSNGVVQLEDTGNSATPIWRFEGHDNSVYKISVDENGNVYSASFDNTVKRLTADGEEEWTYTSDSSFYGVDVSQY